MKMHRLAVVACISFLASILLHGCGSDSSTPSAAAPPSPPPPPPPEVERKSEERQPRVKKAVCQCGSTYGCQGGGSWCEKMERVCGKCNRNCEPQCAWSCESPKCAQTCGPKCKAPKCSVRCKGFNTKLCRMECGKPNCRVVCPKHGGCAGKDCAKCKTECSKPVCEVACKRGNGDEQPCRNVCSQPVCHWDCKQPSVCPKPKCSMKCEKPMNCMQEMLAAGQAPPLEPGETEVTTVDVPTGFAPGPAPAAASFLQGKTAMTMRVNFTSMGEDRSVQSGELELALTQVDTAAFSGTSWVKEVREENGVDIESEASCTNGKFHCQGDATWCTQQQKAICEARHAISSRHHAHVQDHLQP